MFSNIKEINTDKIDAKIKNMDNTTQKGLFSS